jgi:hypothetical protein
VIAFPTMTTKDDPDARSFQHPATLGWRKDDLLYCGHFDGHDCYKTVCSDHFVLVYANEPDAVFKVSWAIAAFWKSQHPDMTEWGSMRAVVKAKAALAHKIDDLLHKLIDVVRNLPDDGHDGWCRRAVDVCAEAADAIETLRKGCGT